MLFVHDSSLKEWILPEATVVPFILYVGGVGGHSSWAEVQELTISQAIERAPLDIVSSSLGLYFAVLSTYICEWIDRRLHE